MKIVGRIRAKNTLDQKLQSNKAELIAILGRRRIGKTFLIKHHLKKQIAFHFTGLYQSNLKEHMERFQSQLSHQMNKDTKTPESWFEAFDLLKDYIEGLRSKKKKVIFLDEFPWMATNRSRFLTAFTDFWNSYATHKTDLMIVICGSSASWMINKVMRNKGGLHNRVTAKITLRAFSLYETEQFLKTKKIVLSKYEILKLYMALGGVPYYLEQVEKGESIVQAIDRLCFHKDGLLRHEYRELMASLFDDSKKHESIIHQLQRYPQGLQRDQLLNKAKIKSGGGATQIMEELETSDFITSFVPFQKKNKEKLYKLKDHYMLFYYKFIKNSTPSSKGLWEKMFAGSSNQAWSGLAFENICHEHIELIKKALNIEGILSKESGWNHRGDTTHKGAQIDLLIDRADQIINICEIKFSDNEYVITSSYAKKLRNKLSAFKHFTKTKKTLFPTMISTFGVYENIHSRDLVQQQVKMGALFDKR